MTARKPGALTRTQSAALARAAKAAKELPMPERFWSKVKRLNPDQCWPWIAAARRPDEGYGAFWLDGRHQPASRIAWILTHGPIECDLVICHRCDNPPCCNPAHLFVGTRIENDADRVAKGRQCRGSKQKNAVLNETLVLRLRALAAELGNIKRAAHQLGINEHTAWDVCRRRSWRHV